MCIRRLQILCLALGLTAWMIASRPAAAAPRDKNTFRWAKNWQDAIEESWLRNCPILLHLHDDANPDSQAIYKFYQDANLCKRAEGAVHVPLIRLADSHPTEKRKSADGVEETYSRVFNGVTIAELKVLLERRGDEKFAGEDPAARPALQGFSAPDQQEIIFEGAFTIAKLTELIDKAVEAMPKYEDRIALDEFLSFIDEREAVRQAATKEKWSDVMSALKRMRSMFQNHYRTQRKLADLEDEINVKALALVDKALEATDLNERGKQLTFISKTFASLDAADRAAELLKRMKK